MDKQSPATENLHIAIIGLGYVGLPLAIQFVKAGVKVTGIDIDPKKVEALESGNSYIGHIPNETIQELNDSGKFDASTQFAGLAPYDAVIPCVPTPLNKHREPDLSYVMETGKAIAPYLKNGTVVSLESTTYPGTTDGDLRRVLEEHSGKVVGEDFYLAYSPEREDPSNPDSKVERIPKHVGGLTPACRDKAVRALCCV